MGKGAGRGAAQSPPMLLSREDRVTSFGIDCVDALEWRNWTVGGEYTRQLLVKNVSNKSQKIKYKLPATKYFSMEFPEVIKLSPGMNYHITVTFRPVKHEHYEDYVEIVTTRGSFVIPIRAVLPTVNMQVPANVEFGYCPAKETATRSFHMVNTGELDVSFMWKISMPFKFIPSEGRLAPGESCQVEATFTPEDASVFTASAICLLDGDVSLSTNVSGIGKYPYLNLSGATADFGDILVGRTSETVIRLSNYSLVTASFTITPDSEDDADKVFTVTPSSGTLLANSYEMIRVAYTPATAGTFSSESFRVATPGGNSLELTARGNGAEADVSLSADNLNFGNVEVGQSASRVLYLENASDVVVAYQIATEQMGTFRLDHTVGYIPERSTVHCTIAFAPTEPANFYKRVVVVLKDRSPLCFDLLGTGFAPRKRPPPFTHRQVLHYRQRVARGLPPIPPSPADDVPGDTVAAVPTGAEPPPPDLEQLTPSQQWAQLFDGHDPAKAITIDADAVDFGSCSRLRMSDYKSVTVRNNTDAKVTCRWVMPGTDEPGADGSPGRPAFNTFPETADLKPGGTQEFRIGFRPGRDNKYYCQDLELIAFVKTMRNFRLVTEETFCPPWTVSLQASGNTFTQNSEEFMPKAELSTRKLLFTPCHQGDAVYETVALVNDGDTPVKFEFQEVGVGAVDVASPSSRRPFSCRPASGVVGANSFHLISFKFQASESKRYTERFVCMLNNSPANSLDLALQGQGFLPGLAVENGGNLFFKPTCVGATSTRKITIQNTARIPVMFEWQVPARLAQTLFVEPHAGLLRGNETATVTWRFLPQKQRKYEARIPCAISSVRNDPESFAAGAQEEGAPRVAVSMTGEGTFGAITMDPPDVDFDTVTVGHLAERTVTLYNQSSGNLRYQLELSPGEPGGSLEGDNGEVEVWVDEREGQLPARSFKAVKVFFRPQRRSPYGFRIACHTKGYGPAAQGAGAEDADANPPPSSSIVAHATYPTLAVVDARVAGLAKPFLWQRLSVTDLNVELEADLSPAELEINREKHLVSTQHIMQNLRQITCDFGTDVEGAAPTVTHLQLRNMGHLPVEWSVGFKDDQEVEMENWVELAEAPDKVERHHNFIIENGVFKIEPRGGHLEEGETVDVRVTYLHAFPGPHELPVLLSVQHGKRVRLHLKGDTVDPSCQRLVLATGDHTMKPVALGDEQPPWQTFPLRNGGPTEIDYAIDTAALEEMTRGNFQYPVLKCLNPTGTIPVGGLRLVNFVFQPLESKEYTVELPVSVVGTGEAQTFKLTGRGYHPKVAGQSRELAREDHDKLHWAGFHSQPTLVVPDFPAALSHEALSLGSVPVYSVTRRLVMVRNASQRMPCDYEWDTGVWGTDDVDGALKVVPARGRIPAGGVAMCKLEYTAGARPQLLDGEVRCVVTPIDVDLIAAEEEAARPRTPEDEIIEKHGPGYNANPKFRERNLLVDRVSVLDATTDISRKRMEPMARKFEAQMDTLRASRVPVPREHPSPHALFVTLDGRVHPTVDYKRRFGLAAYQACFAPLLDTRGGPSLPTGMAAEIIRDMILDVVCDDTTARAMANLDAERVPTFYEVSGPGLRGTGGKMRVPLPHKLAGSYAEFPGPGWVEVTEAPTAGPDGPPVLPPPGARAAAAGGPGEAQEGGAGGAAAGPGPGSQAVGEEEGAAGGSMEEEGGEGAHVGSAPEGELELQRVVSGDLQRAAEEEEAGARKRAALLEAPEFQALVEFVVEASIFDMMREGAVGSWVAPPEDP